MSSSPTPDLALLIEYAIGVASPEEMARVETWVTSSPRGRQILAYVQRVVAVVRRQDVSSRAEAVNAISYELSAHIARDQAESARVSAHSEGDAAARRHVLGGRLWRRDAKVETYTSFRRAAYVIGATLSLGVAIAVASYKVRKGSETTHTYATQSGQQATITLPDSSRVTLAPQTTLRLTHFGSASRIVDLQGEAYFEVTRSAGAPFIVRTGTVAAQALGTAFLIRNYTTDEHIHVAVAEGKVGVTAIASTRRGFSPFTITAGHIGDVTDSTVIVNRANDLTPETDWLHGKLVFRNVSVRDVLQTLNHWYGYHFRCNDSSMMRKSVTLALEAQSSAAALSTLEQFLDVHLTVVGDTVTLTPHTGRAGNAATRKQVYDIWIPTPEVGR